MPTTIAAPKKAPAAEKDFLPLQGTDYVELYVGNATRFEDHETTGARMYYEVTALAADGRVVGHSQFYVVCC